MRGLVRIVVVDDSPLGAEALRAIIEADPRLTVEAVAHDGLRAVDLAAALRPTVITMDVHMPRMNGLEAIETIMARHPTHILVVTEDAGADMPFRALSRGAADLVRRPASGQGWGGAAGDDLRRRILALAQTPVTRHGRTRERRASAARTPIVTHAAPARTEPLAAIGIVASTGGPAALARLLGGLPRELAVPILGVQHLAHGFVDGLARWLALGSGRDVLVARAGDLLVPGRVLLAPDDRHLSLDRAGRVRLEAGMDIDGHRPSATRLLQSLAEVLGPRAAGVVLTGMGSDGARGAAALCSSGGRVLVQDAASSAVFGMPRAALSAAPGAEVVPLDDLAGRLGALARRAHGARG